MPKIGTGSFGGLFDKSFSSGTNAGSTGSGGSGRRAAHDNIVFEPDFALVEAGLSVEKTIVLGALDGVTVSWSPFPAAQGYRIFLYQKDAIGARINEKFFDVGRSTVFKWNSNEGAQDGGPQNVNQFNVIPIVSCKRRVGLDGNPATIQKLGAYAKALCKDIAGRTDAQLDVDSFADFDAAFPYEMRRYIDQQTNVGSLISEIEATAMAYFKNNFNGVSGLYLVDETKAPVKEFTDIDFVGAGPVQEIPRSTVYKKVTVDFKHDPVTQELETVEAEDEPTAHKYAQAQEFQVSSLVVDKLAVSAMASTVLASLKRPAPVVKFPFRSKAFGVECGDRISVTRARGFSESGAYESEKWTVIGVAPNPDKATAEVRATQVWPNSDKFKAVAPDGTADWGTATDEEKEAYVYIHDDNELVGSSVHRQSVIAPR